LAKPIIIVAVDGKRKRTSGQNWCCLFCGIDKMIYILNIDSYRDIIITESYTYRNDMFERFTKGVGTMWNPEKF